VPCDRTATARNDFFAITVNDDAIGGIVLVDLERGASAAGKRSSDGANPGRNIMADTLKLRFYPEADYLEVTFSDAPGYMRPTKSDAVMRRVTEDGRVVGFSVFGVSRFQKDHSLEVELEPER
jgi:hypothetical protein